MWDKLKKQIRVEWEMLNLLMNRHPALIEKCRTQAPSDVEIDALAAFLHGFYTGVENIFKRVSVAVDNDPPRGEAWHSSLLNRMACATQGRPAVISEDLRKSLKGYLDFRHMFRHAYTVELQWRRMAPLVFQAQSDFHRLETELRQFLSKIEAADGGAPLQGESSS